MSRKMISNKAGILIFRTVSIYYDKKSHALHVSNNAICPSCRLTCSRRNVIAPSFEKYPSIEVRCALETRRMSRMFLSLLASRNGFLYAVEFLA